MRSFKPTIYLLFLLAVFAIANQAQAANVNFTLSAWFNPTTSIASKALIVKNNGLRLVTDASGNPVCQIHNGTAWQTAATSATALSLSAWQFVACSYDGANIRVYINGEEKGIQAMTENVANTTNVIWLGDDEGATYGNFSGSIDDVKIYKTARSATQIMLDYETGPPPVAHWRMDEKVSGDAKTIYDSSGSNNGTTNDGANNTGMNCAKPGKYGSGCEFDGVDDYVDVGNGASLNITGNQLTMSVWINPREQNINDYIIGKYGSESDLSYGLGITSESGLKLKAYLKTSSGTFANTPLYTVPLNNWLHYAVVYDGSNLKSFINGVLIGSLAANGNISTSTVNLRIGNLGIANTYFNGLIDDVRIYNYSRTQKQVIEDMNAGHPAVGSPVGSYVGYWNFDEGYSTTAYDKSGNNNDGTITGADWTMNGKFGGALDFENTNSDYVTVTDSNSLDVSAISVSVWVKFESVPGSGYRAIISKGMWSTSPRSWEMIYTPGFFQFSAAVSDATYATAVYSITPNTSDWYHIVGTFDNSNMRVYVNGKGGTPIALSGNLQSNNNRNLEIGRAWDGAYWDGLIDEVKIYPFALTPSEIKQEYNRGATMILGSERNSSSTWDDGGFGGAAPVAIWKMDEKTGQYAQDVSDNENTGTLGSTTGSDASDPVWKSAGECKKGSCLSFDGADDRIEVADDSTLNISGTGGTVELWIKLAAYDDAWGLAEVCRYSTITFNGWLFGIRGDDDAINYKRIAVFSPTFGSAYGVTDVSLNEWHHIAWVFDKNGGKNYLYLDGVLDSSGNTLGTPTDASATLRIGYYTDGSRANGTIDDVRIYNYARTPAQIAWDYNQGKPAARWKLDENTGATAYDYYKTKNGTITGPDWTGGADQCKFNYCLDFIPANFDYIDVGDTGIGTNLNSVSFWLYPDSVVSQNIIDFDAGTHKITTDPSGNLTATGWSSPTYYKNGIATASPSLTASTWQNITITTATAFNPNNADFGRVATNYFDGRLDEIKFYTYPLTAAQVKQDYQGGAVRFGPGSGLP